MRLSSMEKLLEELELLPQGCHVLCAVSGGADSICLLHALARLRERRAITLSAAHYNHRLRGEESDRDEAFVAQFLRLCCGEQRGPDGRLLPAVPLFSGSGAVAEEAERRGAGLEETAREMRYAFLRQAAQAAGATCIATAHTADDNVETILFHLARGSGLRGLTGIQPQRDGVIRPLLTTTRQEVEEYLQYYGLPHVEDRTNADVAYARNRIRHQVVPVLNDLFPGVARRLADTAALLRGDEDYLSAQAEGLAEQAEDGPDGLSIPAHVIGDAPDPLAARAVRQLVGRLTGGEQDCSAVHLEGVVGLCRGADPSARLSLPRGLVARREYERLLLSRPRPLSPLEGKALALPGVTMAGEWKLTCEEALYGGQPQTPLSFWLDREAAPALALRGRQTGDRLKLPRRPTKTVKKWCVEEKIPARLRDQLPVLTAEGRVAAVVGLGPDAAFLPREGQLAWHIRGSAPRL